MTAKEKIEAQQKGRENTDIWMVGQQLKEMLRADPGIEELLSTDLDVKDMSLADCAGKIKSWADEQQKKTKAECICVPPNVADGIIREFYGLPGMPTAPAPEQRQQEEEPDMLDFSSFL